MKTKKIRFIKSLRMRLVLVLSISLITIWIVSAIISLIEAKDEVGKVLDSQQILFAERLSSAHFKELSHMQALSTPKLPNSKLDDSTLSLTQKNSRDKRDNPDKENHRPRPLTFAVFNNQGQLIFSDQSVGSEIKFKPKPGFSIQHFDDENWRVFWMPSKNQRFQIAVAQALSYRKHLLGDIFSGQLVWLAGLPMMLLIIYILVSYELRSLRKLGNELKTRSPEDNRQLIAKNIPSEVQPLVDNLNNFFNRTSTMLERERRFTSDAAHELRSPLAAMKVQTELAQLFQDNPKMQDNAFNNIMSGIDRAGQLVEQLLTLSRLESLADLEDKEDIKWQAISESLISERYFSAEKSGITLQLIVNDTPVPRLGQSLLISLMLRNLIDNAIKYCPENTTIQVILNKQSISVCDNGVGISDKHLAHLGERFYRPVGENEKGSGLGLSIVKRIAELHHFTVRFEHNKPQGFCTVISLK